MSEVRVRVMGVGRNSGSQYLLILRDDAERVIPMVIGPCEALSIWNALHSAEASRDAQQPAAHDLLRTLIETLGGRLVKVVIDDLWNKVYYAKLHITQNGETIALDARPSDAVAIALRMKAPLFSTDSVLEAAAQPEEDASPPPEPDLGDLGDV